MNTKIIAGVVIVIAVAAFFVLYPRAAAVPFTSDKITLASPLSGEHVAKTFTVRGTARGTWYFEASFPIEVRDPSGKAVGHGYAMTQENWMTEEFVSYEGSVEVAEYSGPATLVLKKDNPSGLPEHDDSVQIAIFVD